MYVFDVAGFDDALETGLNHARRGVALEPGRQLSRLVLAHASLVADDLDAYRDEAATALALNPANPYAMDSVGYLDVLAGYFERGQSLLDRSLRVNPFHPSFFHDGCFVERYRRKDYQGALDVVAVDRERNFWISVMRAAALGKLDRLDEAASAAERPPGPEPTTRTSVWWMTGVSRAGSVM